MFCGGAKIYDMIMSRDNHQRVWRIKALYTELAMLVSEKGGPWSTKQLRLYNYKPTPPLLTFWRSKLLLSGDSSWSIPTLLHPINLCYNLVMVLFWKQIFFYGCVFLLKAIHLVLPFNFIAKLIHQCRFLAHLSMEDIEHRRDCELKLKECARCQVIEPVVRHVNESLGLYY